MRPILAYACPVWGYAAKTNINILDTLQNSLIRMIVKAIRYMRNDDILQTPKSKRLFNAYLIDIYQDHAINSKSSLPFYLKATPQKLASANHIGSLSKSRPPSNKVPTQRTSQFQIEGRRLLAQSRYLRLNNHR
ncbi:hypothetical protein TNCV_1927761 [Trichonephila clavipes]|nr:hypothetical protein TNCV_1927761 [Trichonephila clavipes]